MNYRISDAAGRLKAELALVLIALLWGTTFVVVKDALTAVSVPLFLAARFSVAAVCMVIFLWRPIRRLDRRQLKSGTIAGFLAGAFLWLGYAFQTLGLRYTTASQSGFLTGLYIVMVPLFSALLLRRWPRWIELSGALLATAGMATLSLQSLSLQFNGGDLLTIACAVAFAIHLLFLNHFSKRENIALLATTQIICAALLSNAALIVRPTTIVWSTRLLAAIIITGILATAVAFLAQTWAQQYVSPTRTAIILALEPVFAWLTAMKFGDEQFQVKSAIAGVLILAGILIVELNPTTSD